MEIQRRKILKEKPNAAELGFGKYFTDYMFTMRYDASHGWHAGRIVPNEPYALDLASSVLHYGQGVFEGMKAFPRPDGQISVFRPDMNWARLCRSAERLCIPPVPVEAAEEGLEELLRLERDWIPAREGTALYIRPAIVATGARLGVHASDKYLFFILLSPVGSYFSGTLEPVRLLAEDFYVRASVGGTGEAKCLGNYASSLFAAEAAQRAGYDQVLWLDANERKYAEEVGSMNIFFRLGDTVVTPALDGAILAGITRASCIELLRANGCPVEERRIGMDEILESAERGRLKEAFGTGTAAVITPVGSVTYGGKTVRPEQPVGEVSRFLYRTLTSIQRGTLPDDRNWNKIIK